MILKLRRGGLSKDSAMAISRLVAGAVDELKPEDVSIIDADTDLSLGSGHDGPGNDEGEEARLTQRLVSTLEPVVGANAIRASVNVDYDQGSTEESQEKYDPIGERGAERAEDRRPGRRRRCRQSAFRERRAMSRRTKAGKPAATDAPQHSRQRRATRRSSKSENAQYGVNKTIIHTILPGGRIQRVTAAFWSTTRS